MRKIPTTMASQHPDHARKPFWNSEEFITTHMETKECFIAFSELGADEQMWDWEGKLVDEAILERLLSEHYDFFQEHPLGQEKFLTFRLPNPKVETEFRLARALMGIASAASLAHQFKLPTSPLFEVVLPMTESAEELINIQQAFSEIARLKHPLYRMSQDSPQHLEIIPLFEQVDIIINSDQILSKYVELHQRAFGYKPPYIRPFLARSDPALNAGVIPVMIAIKVALSKYQKWSQKHNIPLYPIIGAGSLPFRGGLSPLKINDFVREYPGIRTVLLQSAFRYDYAKTQVAKAIEQLQEQLPQTTATVFETKLENQLVELVPVCESFYTSAIAGIAPLVNQIAKWLPRRRERVQHVGLFGYSREIGQTKLPRAIGFTAALYSVGVPPELIGTGRSLAFIQEQGQLDQLEQVYALLREDLEQVGGYLNKSVLSQLAQQSAVWQEIQTDVELIESFLGLELGPRTKSELAHHQLTSSIFDLITNHNEESLPLLIAKAGVLRQSLG